MRHPLKANPAFGTENLKTEAGPGCRDGSEIARRAVLHSKENGRRVIAIDLHDPFETLAIDLRDWPAQINHAVNGMNPHWCQSPTRRLFPVCAPLRWLEHERVWESHCRLNMQYGSKCSRPDALA